MTHKTRLRLLVALIVLGTHTTSTLAVRGAELVPQVPKSEPDAVIYRGQYPGWPWISRTPSGKLVCVWREGTEHMYSPTGRLMLSESLDGGANWSEATTFHDEPKSDDRNVALLPLSDSEWLVVYNTFSQEQVSRVNVLRTVDGGKTWSKPQQVCDFDARTRSAPIRLATGELVLPFYRSPGDQSLAGVSKDNGESWKIVEIANCPGFMGDEWDVAEFPDGRLVGIIRNNSPDNGGWFYMTQSSDRGESWSVPEKTNLQDSRLTSPAQIFLHKGKPVVLYPDARMVSVAMATTDDPALLDWKVQNRVRCYQYRSDSAPIADGGYPVSASNGDDSRYIVDYCHDGDDHLIIGHRIALPSNLGE
jgi:hypothetical protein